MSDYVTKRLLMMIPTLFIISGIIFLLLRVIPGDPAVLILGGEGGGTLRATPEALAALRHALGTDQPLHVQYLSWIGGLLRLDAGTSFVTGQPVVTELTARLPVTLQLAFMTALLSVLVAVPSGVFAAAKHGARWDHLASSVARLGLATPIFLTGTLIILGLSFVFRWTPPLAYAPLWVNPVENLQQMIWPALTMGFYQSTVLFRMTRSSVLAVLSEDYLRTARAKGLHERVVLRRHALGNALLPMVTVSGLQFGSLLGGVVILEQIFAVPGLGRLLVEAILRRDFPVVQATLVLFATLVAVVTLVVDLSYARLDPRVRYD